MNSRNYSVYRGAYMQKGYGLGGVFQKFFKWIVPVFQDHALPALERGAKSVGRETLSSIANIAKDVVEGRNLKDSVQEHTNSAIDNLKDKIENKLKGKGIKGRKRSKNFIILKRKKAKFDDIFSK